MAQTAETCEAETSNDAAHCGVAEVEVYLERAPSREGSGGSMRKSATP